MKTIYKYHLAITDSQDIYLPSDAKVLTVQTQNDEACIWVEIDTEQSIIPITFIMRGTGHSFDGQEGDYIGTFQLASGSLVFHVFLKKELAKELGK